MVRRRPNRLARVLTETLKLFRDGVLAFVYPPYCLVCGSPLKMDEKLVCEPCWDEVERAEQPFCTKCGSSLKNPSQPCPSCKDEGYNFSAVRVATGFNETVQKIIHSLKYRGKRSLAKRLGVILANRTLGDERFTGADLLMPVPLHPSRARERGYNQSELIAEVIGQKLDLPVDKNILSRKKRTKAQTDLDAKQRRENVKGAFVVRRPEEVSGKRVVIVDDVLTTGATLEACTEALLSAGAKEVYTLALARAV